MRIQIVILLSALCIARCNNLNTNSQTNDYDEQLFEEFKCTNVNIRLSEHRTLLHLAAAKGDIQAVNYLIDHKVPVDAKDAWGRDALYYAVQNNRVEMARILLQSHANPHSKDADSKPVFHFVADLDEIYSLNMAKVFLQNNVYVDIPDKFSNTLLHLAIKKGYLSVIKFLLENGAKVNAKNNNNDTPLRLAIVLQPNRSDIVSFLTQKGAQDSGDKVDFLDACYKGNLNLIEYLHEVRAVDVQVKYYNQSGLFRAIFGNGNLEFVKYLASIGVSISEIDTRENTLVNCAAFYNKFDIVKYLIEKGADFKSVNTENSSPLHHAASNNNLEMVKYLLHLGLNSNINDKRYDGRTPLIYSIYRSGDLNLKLVKYLIKSGAQTNITDKNGKTALYWAIYFNKSDIKQYLEQLPTDSTLQTQIDTNSLFFAAAQNNLKLVEQYLNKNISVNVKDEDDGQTPLYRAIYYNGQLDMIKYLHSKGADVKLFDPIQLENFVYLSIIKRKFDVANYLIENGADIKTPGVSVNTPLHGAMEMGNTEFINLLLDKEGYDSRKNLINKSPLDLLIETRNEKLIRYLIFEYKDSEGKSFLHQIASQGQNSDIAFVLERGAHVNAQNNAQNTALHLAALNGHLETVKLLSQQICIHIGATNSNGQTAYDLAQHSQKHSVAQYLSELIKTQTSHQA